MSTLRSLLFGALAIAILSSIAVAQSHYAFTPIANLNDYGGYFEPATITNSDDVLFAPAVKTGGEAVLLWHHGTITTIAQGGQPTFDGGLCWPPTFPSDCPVFGYTFSPVQMNERGDVAFVMSRDGINNVPTPYGINVGVYRYNRRTGVVPVVVPGTRAPGGGLFWGSYYLINVNRDGDIYFTGMVCTTATVSFPTQACPDNNPGVLSFGAYKADSRGRISPVVKPGDAALDGSYFDFVSLPESSERGDVAFIGHIFSDPCVNPQQVFCAWSLFLKTSSGSIIPLARVGDPSPVPGKAYTGAGSPTPNSTGDVAFLADFSPAGDFSDDAVLLYTHGRTMVIAKTGDSMPDGHTLAKVGTAGQDIAINNAGDIVFDATLTDGTQAIYLWRHGHLSPVAKTGTVTSAGVISNLDDYGLGWASTQLWINDPGQILFMARFQDGGGAMLVATPH